MVHMIYAILLFNLCSISLSIKPKVDGSHYTAISDQWASTGMTGTTQVLEPCAANPPEVGLVAHRRSHG